MENLHKVGALSVHETFLNSRAHEGSASEHWSSLHISDKIKRKSVSRVSSGDSRSVKKIDF